MIRQAIAAFSVASALFAVSYVGLRMPPQPEKVFEPQPVAGSLPQLESEDSPFFSRQTKSEGGFKTEQIFCYRKDHSVVHLYYGKNNVLDRVVAYRDGDNKNSVAYEANYDASGRQIVSSRSYNVDGKLDTSIERQADGRETYQFFRAGQLIQTVEVAADGSSTKKNFENGKLKNEEKVAAPAETSDLVFWDAAKSQPRLRVKTAGGRLSSWEYLSRDAKVTQTGKVLPDGSLEFSYLDNGRVKVRQVWKLTGQDWERSYYTLRYSERLSEKTGSPEHCVWYRANGSYLKHERYNDTTGVLEMRRMLDNDNRVESVQDFVPTPYNKSIWEPINGVRPRCFVPDGINARPGDENDV
ncbi:MAG: hypothetical protein K2X81_23330, partial [Candidatus Obscuribacterales bacterium]|nr:hypothetical protein [Candidatus Obscuribacterales bacterium]